jgi:hypothetical protein
MTASPKTRRDWGARSAFLGGHSRDARDMVRQLMWLGLVVGCLFVTGLVGLGYAAAGRSSRREPDAPR